MNTSYRAHLEHQEPATGAWERWIGLHVRNVAVSEFIDGLYRVELDLVSQLGEDADDRIVPGTRLSLVVEVEGETADGPVVSRRTWHGIVADVT
jgi:uncharacterized protein involved in type VI secretion and phage assembly